MTRKICKTSLLLCVCLGMFTLDAAAWGPRAQRAVTGTAIQVIRRTYPDAFKSWDYSYDEDVLRGGSTGALYLNRNEPFESESQAIVALENEIRLLRETRKFGFGSYMSFRMGVVSALMADLMLPFALDTVGNNSTLAQQIDADIDARLDGFEFNQAPGDREFIRSVSNCLQRRREYFEDGARVLADDYERGLGYAGFLKQAAPACFSKAVIGVADVWNTILKVDADLGNVAPSDEVLTWYLVDEIRYLLVEKKNFYQAEKTYANFEQVNPGIPESYGKVGDLFYAFGTEEAEARGVREWRIAYDMQGLNRRDVGMNLSDHYIKVGKGLLEHAETPEARDDDLPNALHAFKQALEFNQNSEDAANSINETNVRIAERKERRQLNVNIIASGERVIELADKSRVAKDFGNAIATYNQSIGLFQAIDDEFKDQAQTAKDRIRDIRKNITDVINEVLDAGSDAIDQGDKLVDEHRFEEAIASYERVPGIVSVIPADETTTVGKDKVDMIQNSQKKIDEAKVAKTRWEELQRQREEAARAAAAGGGAARPPAAAGAAPGAAPAPAPAPPQ